MAIQNWKLIDSGVKSASTHMQTDENLLKSLQVNQNPILHFYDWAQDSATYGYFIKPEKFLNLENAKKHSLELARRPTGGGIVFHKQDLAFSVLLPNTHPHFSLNTLDNYAYINEIVREAIIKFIGKGSVVTLLPEESFEPVVEASSFCMAKPTKYDVILNGLKVGGGAERLTKFGLLHQGTISLSLPSDAYLKDLLLSESILHCMKKNSCLLLSENVIGSVFEEAKIEMKELLKNAFFSK